jgi:hypothetical protein
VLARLIIDARPHAGHTKAELAVLAYDPHNADRTRDIDLELAIFGERDNGLMVLARERWAQWTDTVNDGPNGWRWRKPEHYRLHAEHLAISPTEYAIAILERVDQGELADEQLLLYRHQGGEVYQILALDTEAARLDSECYGPQRETRLTAEKRTSRGFYDLTFDATDYEIEFDGQRCAGTATRTVQTYRWNGTIYEPHGRAAKTIEKSP